MLDLKKLEAKFKTLFENETEDSFNEWLEDKRRREVLATLGEGRIEHLSAEFVRIEKTPCVNNPIPFTHDYANNTIGDTTYAMAA